MNIHIKKNNQTAVAALRRLGYAPYTNREGKESFVRRVRGGEFPRFHLYINKEDHAMLTCAVHLDQRAPVYRGAAAHGGDYDSPEVLAESERLQNSTGL